MDPAVSELRILAWTVILGIVQIAAVAYAAVLRQPGGLTWAAGPRDTPLPPPTGIAARLTRARDNFLETFPFFAAAVLAAVLSERTGPLTAWGASLYLWGRIAFVPLYALGVPWLRSAAWGVATAGLLMIVGATLAG